MSNSETKRFFEFTTSRPVAILMVVLGFCVFGFISYNQLPVNLMPDISYPSLTVRTEYAGTAPEEVETTISRPVEQALGVVNGLVSISSISKAGQSDVKLEFTWDSNMNEATADVREKLDQVFLPDEINRPLILRFDPSLDPIIRIGVSGNASLIYLRYLADEEIKRALETVEGVAAVKVKGGLEEEIRVELNEQQLTLIGIDIQQVRERLRQENVNLAGGNLKEGQTEYLVRTLNEFQTVDEVGEVVVGNWNGTEIKVRDIAHVSRTFKDREIITRISNTESVEIEIFKEADANIVSVAERVRNKIFGSPEQQEFVKKMKEDKFKKPPKPKKEAEEKKADAAKAKKGKGKKGKGHGNGDRNREAMVAKQMTNFINYSLPGDVKIDLLSDQSVFIKNSVDEVKNTAMIGGLLAVLVLFVFLRKLSATLIVGLSIPVSIVATFAPMKIFDVSLNIMSLGGLALGIGMLVDNSIVVLESIARCRDEGDNLIQATIRGVEEVGGAVFASTLTTIAVFFPIVFVEGVAGQIFGNMALTVVFSLFASLGVALFLIPMLSSRQSSTFTRGVQVEQIIQYHIFRFSTEGKIDKLLVRNSQGWLTKLGSGALCFLLTLGLILFKILQAHMAVLLSFAKRIVLFAAVIVSPLFGLMRLVRVFDFRISDWLTAVAAQKNLFFITFPETVWPDFMVVRSVSPLVQDMRTMHASFKQIGPLRVPGPLTLLKLPFVLARFFFHFLLELVFRVVHFLVIAIAVILKGLFLMLKLALTVPSRLIVSGFNFGYSRLDTAYPKILTRALESRGPVLGTVSVLFLLTLFVIGPRLGSELIPEVHQGEFNVELTFPVGTPVEQTDARIARIQGYLMDLPGVKKVASVSGTDKTASTESEEGEHTSKITVTLSRPGDRELVAAEPKPQQQSEETKFAAVAADLNAASLPADGPEEKPENAQPEYRDAEVVEEEELVAQIRDELRGYSGVRWKISRPVLFSFKTPIEVEIHGYSLPKLQQYSTELEERLESIPGIIDIKSNIQRGNPEVQIVYNRPLLAQYGLNIRDVAAIVRNKVRGDVATEFKEQDRKIDVLVRLRETDRESIDDLRRIIVNPGIGKAIPLEAIAEINVREGPSEIRRVDQQRTAVVTANLSGRSLSQASSDIFDQLQDMNLPEDFTFSLAGQNKEMETSLNSLKLALALAIFLVYIVMASQFESTIHPLIIIFTIPLALIGVILYLYAFSIPLSIVVFLGMIMLAGIVVNNAIVLVDYINKLQERGIEKTQAILQAGKARLRPIVMTTATTVLGLLPMALGLGDGAEIRTPMAITVIIGLISSTILTLVIIPTVYSLVDVKQRQA